MSIEIVSPEERETTRKMIQHLIALEEQEPPSDAGGSPVVEHHEAAAREWADWDRQRRAWVTLIAPRLLTEAKGDVFTANPTTSHGAPERRETDEESHR